MADDGFIEVSPNRIGVTPHAHPRRVNAAVRNASVVQFAEPVSASIHEAVQKALADRPDVELYVYGQAAAALDSTLSALDGYEFLERLSLNGRQIVALDGLARFARLRELTLQGATGISLQPLRGLGQLTKLTLPGPVKDADVIGTLARLEELHAPAAGPVLSSLRHHPRLRRLELNFGAETDLSALPTLSELLDLSIWQIRNLEDAGLQQIGAIPKLRALSLGALKHITSLAMLESRAGTIRYLMLEQLPNISTLEPLRSLRELRACALFDARPQDRSLAPLAALAKLADVTIGDVYPKTESEALVAALQTTRITIRGKSPGEPSGLRWRSLMPYVDDEMSATTVD